MQPVLVEPRQVPKLHPSGLHDWNYANLLCLNAYTSKYNFAAGTIAAMKLYTTTEKGQTKIAGKFSGRAGWIVLRASAGGQPLQIELLDRQGKTLKREQGWWWMRKGEQRICVGCHAGPERAPENAVPAVLVKSTTPNDLTGCYIEQRGTLVLGRTLSVLLLSSALLAQAPSTSSIKFEDATAAAGIQFTHSFGSQKLGSLLEGTGGGCVWFDYNNDGKPDLYVSSGKPLEACNASVSAEAASRRILRTTTCSGMTATASLRT